MSAPTPLVVTPLRDRRVQAAMRGAAMRVVLVLRAPDGLPASVRDLVVLVIGHKATGRRATVPRVIVRRALVRTVIARKATGHKATVLAPIVPATPGEADPITPVAIGRTGLLAMIAIAGRAEAAAVGVAGTSPLPSNPR